MIRKFISELVGTMLLVILGCGTAVAANQYVTGIYNVAYPFTMLLIAVAFGLALMALIYTIGHVSGSHVNPAVSIASLIDGRMSVFECIYYVCAQILGGVIGAFALTWIFGAFTSLGANGYGTLSALEKVTTLPVALGVEAILTFIFVLVVLSTTKEKKGKCNSGIIIGLTYTLVHLMGIPFTGASVNPARSIGPAILTKGECLKQLWVFIVGPMIGAILAALFYKFIICDRTELATEDNFVALEDDEEDFVEEVESKKEDKKPTKKVNQTKKGKK